MSKARLRTALALGENPLLPTLREGISPPRCLWWGAVVSVGFGFRLPAAVTVINSHKMLCFINSAGGQFGTWADCYVRSQHLGEKSIVFIVHHLILNLKELLLQKSYFRVSGQKKSPINLFWRKPVFQTKCKWCLLGVVFSVTGQGITSHCPSPQRCLCEISCFVITISFSWPKGKMIPKWGERNKRKGRKLNRIWL